MLTLLPARPAQAWWSRPTDKPHFEQRSGNPSHVRCTSETVCRALDGRPDATAGGATVGSGIRRGWQGSIDKCTGSLDGNLLIVLGPTCNGGGSGYLRQVRSQPDPDRCMKPGGEAAPTRNVN